MSTFALIVAAHGSKEVPSVNARVCDLAGRAAALAGYDTGVAAFHQGTPTFGRILDETQADHAVVVPLMTSGGYYCETVLPRELIKNTRYAGMMVHKTDPVGTHPSMAALVESRARRRLAEYGVSPGDTTLAMVGHGTERHLQSRVATEQVASALAQRGVFAQVITAFLDEEPGVESIPQRASSANLIVEPFFISEALHTVADVPGRLGLPCVGSGPCVRAGHAGKDVVICDTAVGVDDAILGVVIARAVYGRTVLVQRVAGAA